ncbi:hypothetical protein TYRP_012383 [Tyrophagus putrescentiae]|nr:hypothetical protein TYRP_012383 [Tyrophagus putrescentiae]
MTICKGGTVESGRTRRDIMINLSSFLFHCNRNGTRVVLAALKHIFPIIFPTKATPKRKRNCYWK